MTDIKLQNKTLISLAKGLLECYKTYPDTRIAKQFDEVVVAISINKKSSYGEVINKYIKK